MNTEIMRRLKIIIAVLPGLALIPAIATPLGVYRPGVELAQYFQTLALVRDGLASYTYLTPAESSGGAHLHSFLSAPLLAVGIRPAGRIISVLVAIIGVLLLILLVTRLVNKETGLLAGALLWLHPLFLRLAATWNPYILGITLTIGAVLATYKWLETESRIWFVGMIVILFTAVLNHTWEGSIALPIVALLFVRRRYKAIGAVVLTVLAGISLFFLIRTFQPQGAPLIQQYSVLGHPNSLFSINWLLWDLKTWQSWRWLVVLIIPMTVIMIGITGIGYAKLRTETPLVLCTWLISALTLLVLLPRGWRIHEYYAWGLVAPLAASAAWVASLVFSRIRFLSGGSGLLGREFSVSDAQILLAILLIVGSMAYAVEGQADQMNRDWVPTEGEKNYTNGPGHPTMAAGVQLSATDIENPEGIVFVGPWTGRNNNYPPKLFLAPNGVLRTMIYSDVLVRQRHLDDPNTPRFATNTSQVADCDAMVIAEPETSTVDVERCN